MHALKNMAAASPLTRFSMRVSAACNAPIALLAVESGAQSPVMQRAQLTGGLGRLPRSAFEANDQRWVFGYQITIHNTGSDVIQLISRYWRFQDLDGAELEVKGQGVIGQQPRLEPGQVLLVADARFLLSHSIQQHFAFICACAALYVSLACGRGDAAGLHARPLRNATHGRQGQSHRLSCSCGACIADHECARQQFLICQLVRYTSACQPQHLPRRCFHP